LTLPITKELKDKVIREYLRGKSRNQNARDSGLGAGTVTNIIQEFNNKLEEYEPEAMRELAVQLRKAGIEPNDCVRGAQIVNKMSDLGIDKDKCLTVIETLQTRSIEKGVHPEKCGELISHLFEISKSEPMPLDEVPNYVRQKVQEKERLDAEVDVRETQIKNLKAQTDTQLRQNNVTMENINSYLVLRQELADLGIPETDIERTMNVIRNFNEEGFDANRIVKIASTALSLEEQVSDLSNQCHLFRDAVSRYQNLVQIIQAIIEVGGSAVGPNELRVVVDSIRWRAAADRVPTVVAAQTIMNRLNEMYKIIGFEKETKTKEVGLLLLEEKIEDLNEIWAAKLQAIDALIHLAAKGVTKDHVVEFRNFFLGNQNRINLSTFVADLNRYGSAKQVLNQLDTDIMKRTYQSRSSKMEISSLLDETKNLENENASMQMTVFSLKTEASRLTTKCNSMKAKIDLSNIEEKENGRVERSATAISDANTKITANTKPRAGQLGNDAAGTAGEISSISNPQSTTTTSAGVAGINNQTDAETSATS
jgi:hypothetical protein